MIFNSIRFDLNTRMPFRQFLSYLLLPTKQDLLDYVIEN